MQSLSKSGTRGPDTNLASLSTHGRKAYAEHHRDWLTAWSAPKGIALGSLGTPEMYSRLTNGCPVVVEEVLDPVIINELATLMRSQQFYGCEFVAHPDATTSMFYFSKQKSYRVGVKGRI